jgi:3-hydroxybutyrate dehydrogenase
VADEIFARSEQRPDGVRKYRLAIDTIVAGNAPQVLAAFGSDIAGFYRHSSQHVFPAAPAARHNEIEKPKVTAPSQRKEPAMNIHARPRTVPDVRSLAGKVSIVTGSTSGIGLGIARALAAAGSAVMLNGFGRAEDIAAAQQEISSTYDVAALYSPADMTSPAAIGEMVDLALAMFGRLDVLVNNAGIQHVAPIDQFPAEKWDAILAINLSSAFHATRLAVPAMRRNNWGRIVNVASAHGLVGSPFKSAYVAAKHGILGLTKVVALETAEQGITCNAICPGYVYTPLVEAQIEGQAKAHGIPRDEVIRDVLLAQQPNKRFASVEELGALVTFLTSDAAASITGAALPVDGGWTAH